MATNDDWLALVQEETLEPDLSICDPHHHLWDRSGNRYMLEDLIADGMARDVIRTIQDIRKSMQLEYTDRIEIGFVTENQELRSAISKFAEYIKRETLAVSLIFDPLPGVDPVEVNIAGSPVQIYVKKVQQSK